MMLWLCCASSFCGSMWLWRRVTWPWYCGCGRRVACPLMTIMWLCCDGGFMSSWRTACHPGLGNVVHDGGMAGSSIAAVAVWPWPVASKRLDNGHCGIVANGGRPDPGPPGRDEARRQWRRRRRATGGGRAAPRKLTLNLQLLHRLPAVIVAWLAVFFALSCACARPFCLSTLRLTQQAIA